MASLSIMKHLCCIWHRKHKAVKLFTFIDPFELSVGFYMEQATEEENQELYSLAVP